MDMAEESAEESQAAESGYEEELVPKIITDEVFEEMTARGQMVSSLVASRRRFKTQQKLQTFR